MSNTSKPLLPIPVLITDLGRTYPTKESKHKRRFGIFQCPYCDVAFKAMTDNVKRRFTVSCGCYGKKVSVTHGNTNHALYSIWAGIITRCTNPKATNYKDYGAIGIKVCTRWLEFNNFIEDMFTSYEKGLTIDRRNNNGDYEPSNCRWVTQTIQHRNTRRIMITNTSGYRGVSFNKQANKWQTYISTNSKNTNIGSSDTALEAAIIYDTYVIINNLEHTINGVLHSKLPYKGDTHHETYKV